MRSDCWNPQSDIIRGGGVTWCHSRGSSLRLVILTCSSISLHPAAEQWFTLELSCLSTLPASSWGEMSLFCPQLHPGALQIIRFGACSWTRKESVNGCEQELPAACNTTPKESPQPTETSEDGDRKLSLQQIFALITRLVSINWEIERLRWKRETSRSGVPS